MAVLNSITYQVRIKDDSMEGGYYYPPKTSVYEAPLEDLMADTTKRSAKGRLNIDRIGTFPNLTMEVGVLNAQEMATLLQHLRKLPIILDFFDPELGNYRTNVEVYCKSRTPKLLHQNPIQYQPMSIGLTAYDKVSTNY